MLPLIFGRIVRFLSIGGGDNDDDWIDCGVGVVGVTDLVVDSADDMAITSSGT